MNILTKRDLALLNKNSLKDFDNVPPVVRLYEKFHDRTWLLYKTDLFDNNLVFGVYGKKGCKAILSGFYLSELEKKHPDICRDPSFKTKYRMSDFLTAAETCGELILNTDKLEKVFQRSPRTHLSIDL